MGASKVTAEDFVVAWATSKSLDEVCHSTGLNKPTVQQRSYQLRKLGVKLPKLSPPTKFDDLRIAQLNSLIKKYDIRKKG